jgi:hypothetical protein
MREPACTDMPAACSSGTSASAPLLAADTASIIMLMGRAMHCVTMLFAVWS